MLVTYQLIYSPKMNYLDMVLCIHSKKVEINIRVKNSHEKEERRKKKKKKSGSSTQN